MNSFVSKIQKEGRVTIPSNIRKLRNLTEGTFVELKIISIYPEEKCLTKEETIEEVGAE